MLFLLFSFLFVAHTISMSYVFASEDLYVTDLQVQGNKSLSESAILAKVKVRKGDIISQEVLNEDIKRLYATDYFKDVIVELESFKDGKRVIFEVQEKPILKEINIKGNTVLSTKDIIAELSSDIDTFLNLRVLKSDVGKIKQLYIERGFPEVNIDYDINIDEETNRAQVDIIIVEGARLKIREIKIKGNDVYSDKKILKLMQTRRDTLFTSGLYKEGLLEEDIKRILSFYNNQGYLDTECDYKISEPDSKNRILVSINIKEGKRYIAGEIQIKGNDKFNVSEIQKVLEMPKGEIFTHQKIKQDIVNIQSFYFDKGYIFADVKADTVLNPDTGEIDVKYNIIEGDKAYVEKIRVRGNTKTKDIVIRRELKVYPGEPFDGEKLRKSKKELDYLGIFQSVNFDTEPGTAPNRKNLIVDVKEAKTGEFSFGAGYSSVDDFVGFIELGQRNFDYKNWPTFTGDGQKINIKAEFGTVKEDYDLSFTEPWIFDRPISFGFDLYQRSRERERDVGYAYDQRRRGGNIRLGKELKEYLYGSFSYRYEDIKISDVASDASEGLESEEGENNVSSISLGITQDLRDNRYDPSSGRRSYLSVETAGGVFGGDKDFIKYNAGSSWYYSFLEQHVIEFKLTAGLVDDYGDSDSVPIYERFYAGGANTIRGYDVREVGPQYEGTDDPKGGEAMLIGNIEYVFPIIKNFKGAVFYDIGNVWEEIDDFGQGGYESSLGTGVRIKTPIGPIKLDYGYPIDSDVSSNGRFHFSMGRTF